MFLDLQPPPRGLTLVILIALVLGPAAPVARAGADFIGGQANAEDEDVPDDPEAVEGGLEDRARAMQQWLQAREAERREMGFAHVYERPHAISDDFAGSRHSRSIRADLGRGKRSHAHAQKSSAPTAHSRGGKSRGSAELRRHAARHERAPQASSKAVASSVKHSAKRPAAGKPGAKRRR